MDDDNLEPAPSIGEYLIRRLQDYGIRDVFGIPGDYVLSFYTMLEQSPLNIVGCTREDCAGFAADAYARVHGMGALCVTYCVGGLSVCNSIAGAYAEKSPVVMITGSPGLRERIHNPLLHHMVRNFRTQYDVFEKLCCAGTELDDPLTAFSEIDRVLATCDRFKRPVYIEIPRDMVHVRPQTTPPYKHPEVHSDTRALDEAVDETVERIRKRPSAGDAARGRNPSLRPAGRGRSSGRGLAAFRWPPRCWARAWSPKRIRSTWAFTNGALGREEVTKYVEASDCVLMLGTFMTDINLGSTRPSSTWPIASTSPANSSASDITTITTCGWKTLCELWRPGTRGRKTPPPPAPTEFWKEPFTLRPADRITVTRMIDRLDEQLEDGTVVIADVGDSLFAATELTTRGKTEFISPAYYTSMGFAVPAALGVHVARPNARVVAIVGDGAFQMTGMELSNLVRYKFPTIVIVLDNQGYGTERLLHAGDWKFNDIQPWQYHRLPEVLGGGTGYLIRTEGEFDQALNAAWNDQRRPKHFASHARPERLQPCPGNLGRANEQNGRAEITSWADMRLPSYTIGATMV